MLRVLHVLDHSLPLHSGYTFRTLSLLQEQRRSGWDTCAVTSPKQGGSDAAQETVDGWSFFRTRPPRTTDLPLVRELALMAALERRLEEVVDAVAPNVIHAHSPVLNVLPALRVGRRRGIPVVYEVRAFWEDAAVDHGTTTKGSLRYRLTRAIETYALRRAAHVFTICEGLRADIVARGLLDERVTVIPNGVDPAMFSAHRPKDAALARQLGLEGAAVLGFIGSFYAYEGLDLLVAAMPSLLRRRADVKVLLVGGGPQDDSLRAQVRSLGLVDRVVFTGRVPHGEVDRFYDLVDILVYPRRPMRLTELVTPLKPLEAMAGRKLIVASDVGGHRELISDGETGRLFAAGRLEALEAVLFDLLARPQQWDELRSKGRHFVETRRTWQACAAGYGPVYARLTPALGTGGRVAPTI
jgi:PEP-CTERM/exosortase A-associated glycosyltransferase